MTLLHFFTWCCWAIIELGVTVLFSLLNRPNQEKEVPFDMQRREARGSPVNSSFTLQFEVSE